MRKSDFPEPGKKVTLLQTQTIYGCKPKKTKQVPTSNQQIDQAKLDSYRCVV